MLKFVVLIGIVDAVNCFFIGSFFERNIIFTVYPRTGKNFTMTSKDKLSEKGCETDGKLAFITHGWRENISSGWVKDMVGNLTEIRGGCIIFIDYSFYGINPNYFMFLANFASISKVLTKKLIQLESQGFDPDKWFMFGHSAGARLVIDAAANFGYQKVKEIDACDLAGPAFDFQSSTKNPQKAAKNVACIHTSALVGTVQRLCHQDWLMGYCGRDQAAADLWKWMFCLTSPTCDSSLHESHGLCPHFYTSAFKNDFVADNSHYKCGTEREPKKVIDGFKMGYMESRKSPQIVGDFFAATSVQSPWNVMNGSIKPKDNRLMHSMFN